MFAAPCACPWGLVGAGGDIRGGGATVGRSDGRPQESGARPESKVAWTERRLCANGGEAGGRGGPGGMTSALEEPGWRGHAKKRSGGGTRDYGPLGPLDPGSKF